VERRLFRDQAILHGPFGYTTVTAGYESADAAAAALAAVTADPPADPFELPRVGQESAAFQMLDPGDSMAHATAVVWRRDRWLLAVGMVGFDPVTMPEDLVRLAQVVDERSADAGDMPLEQPAQGAPTLRFDDLWSLRPAPLALARTSVAGSSADRFANLKLATKQINNVVVQSGEEFSLNQTVGPTTEERGFKMGYAIIGTDTVPDVGGGICQVATTLFQSVFAAGLEITERNAHAYWIPRYRIKGLDATVYDPYLDFKFRNDLTQPVLLQGFADGENVVFAVFSEAPPRQVEISEPEITNVVPIDPDLVKQYSTKLAPGEQVTVEHAHEGFDVAVTRVVREGDKELHHDEVVSTYRPARNVLLIGGVDPASAAPPEHEPTFQPHPSSPPDDPDDGRPVPH
jgi:hypothetical protein